MPSCGAFGQPSLSSDNNFSTANIQINSHTACTPARFFSKKSFKGQSVALAPVGLRHQPVCARRAFRSRATRPPARFFSKKSFKGRFAGACAHSERGDPARGHPAHVGIQPTCHCGSAAADGGNYLNSSSSCQRLIASRRCCTRRSSSSKSASCSVTKSRPNARTK